MSRKLAHRLADIFPNSSHVQFHNLEEKTDTEIWEFAKANNFCIVTQDADFAERSRLYGSPPKIVWLRCGNAPTKQVEILIRSGQEAIIRLLDNANLHCLELRRFRRTGHSHRWQNTQGFRRSRSRTIFPTFCVLKPKRFISDRKRSINFNQLLF